MQVFLKESLLKDKKFPKLSDSLLITTLGKISISQSILTSSKESLESMIVIPSQRNSITIWEHH